MMPNAFVVHLLGCDDTGKVSTVALVPRERRVSTGAARQASGLRPVRLPCWEVVGKPLVPRVSDELRALIKGDLVAVVVDEDGRDIRDPAPLPALVEHLSTKLDVATPGHAP